MKRLFHSASILLPLSFLFTACVGGKASTVYLNDGISPKEPVFYGNVHVFTARIIPREVDELGSVCVTTRSETPPNEYLVLIQKEAAKIGADAVIGYEIMDGTAMGVAVHYRDKK